jgi:hypothetical protein
VYNILSGHSRSSFFDPVAGTPARGGLRFVVKYDNINTWVLPFRGDAFRVVYAVQLADEIWVVHAFQKKSTQGIKTPKREIDLIKERLKRLKEMLL